MIRAETSYRFFRPSLFFHVDGATIEETWLWHVCIGFRFNLYHPQDGVVVPRHLAEVLQTIALCDRNCCYRQGNPAIACGLIGLCTRSTLSGDAAPPAWPRPIDPVRHLDFLRKQPWALLRTAGQPQTEISAQIAAGPGNTRGAHQLTILFFAVCIGESLASAGLGARRSNGLGRGQRSLRPKVTSPSQGDCGGK